MTINLECGQSRRVGLDRGQVSVHLGIHILAIVDVAVPRQSSEAVWLGLLDQVLDPEGRDELWFRLN